MAEPKAPQDSTVVTRTSEIATAKIERIRSQLDRGEYSIDLDAIAAGIVDSAKPDTN